MDIKTLEEKLRQMKKMGFVKTHRCGDTGIGKTLEDLLGVRENNIPLPDIGEVAELKSYRKNAKSMITLFTLEPLPKGGDRDRLLLDVRVFDEATKKSVYATQTATAKKKKISNCPLCAIGHDANKSKIWQFNEMDADHVSAWSKGGATSVKNCQMLCKTHNRAKGNR